MRRRRRPDRDNLPFLHLLPNLVTIIGLCAGLTSIRYVFVEMYQIAAALIIFAAVIDSLDGLLARRLNAASSFGAELDSLADFLNFGVAPGVLMFHFALSDAAGIGWIFVLVFVICCCLRLARFNVNRDDPAPGGRAHFVGVPAPAGALLAMLPLFVTLDGVIDMANIPLIVAPYLGLIGLLMVSKLRTPSPKSLRISKDTAGWLLIGMAIMVGMMFSRFWLLMVLVDLAYIGTLIYIAATMRRAPQT